MRLLLTALVLVWPALAFGQVQPSDLIFEGSFKLPTACDNRYLHSGHGLAFDGAGGLYVSNYAGAICHVTIPQSPDPSGTRASWPVAGLISGPVKPFRIAASDTLGGLLVDGNDLLATVFTRYSTSGSPNAAFYRINRQTWATSTPTSHGDADILAGALADIPAKWRPALGGDTLAGLCCPSIIGRSSFGMAASSLTRDDIGRRNSTSARLVGYLNNEPRTLGDWNESNRLWNNATDKPGIVFVDDSVLFFGRYGSRYCYGEAANCGDPSSNSKGDHAYPYDYTVWRYDAADFAEVAAGRKQPYELVPVRWFLTLPAPSEGKAFRGAAFDPVSRRIYVAEEKGDGQWTAIRVFRVAASSPAPVPVDCDVTGYGPPYPVNSTEQQRDPICAPGTPANGGHPGDPILEPIPDSDGDGVNDYLDACPGTPAGVPVDATGCYVPPSAPDYSAEIAAIDSAEVALTDALVAFAAAALPDLSAKWAEVMSAQVVYRDAVQGLIRKIRGGSSQA